MAAILNFLNLILLFTENPSTLVWEYGNSVFSNHNNGFPTQRHYSNPEIYLQMGSSFLVCSSNCCIQRSSHMGNSNLCNNMMLCHSTYTVPSMTRPLTTTVSSTTFQNPTYTHSGNSSSNNFAHITSTNHNHGSSDKIFIRGHDARVTIATSTKGPGNRTTRTTPA